MQQSASFGFVVEYVPDLEVLGRECDILLSIVPPSVAGAVADHVAAAWKLIQWLSTPEREARWSIDSGYVAPRKSAYDTSALKEYTTKYPQALVARDQLQYAQNELGTHEMVQIQKILSDAIQAGITGQAAPQAALDQAQQAATQVLAQFQT